MKILIALLASVAAVSAVPIQVIYTDAVNTGFFDPTPRTPSGSNPGTTLGQQRQIAFEYAASRWSAQIVGTIPIRITAGWSSTPSSGGSVTLASAGPINYYQNSGNFSGLPRNDTFYPSALADQITGIDMIGGGTTNDITVDCNSYVDEVTNDEFIWDYDLASPGIIGRSFVRTAIHEIGHGLGVIGSLQQNGSYTNPSPFIWDRMTIDGSGNFLPSLTAAARATLITSDDLYLTGTNILLGNNNLPARLHAPAVYSPGSSLGHFREDSYSAPGSINELLTATHSFATQAFGHLVTSALKDMGYTLSDNQAPEATVTSPAAGKSYTSAALAASGITGTAIDTSAAGSSNAVGLMRVRAALFSQSQGKWYRWGNSAFEAAAFNYANHTKEVSIDDFLPVTTGNHTWQTSLPTGLADGGYELHVTAVDQNDNGSAFVVRTFTIDNTAPSVVIEPWANNTQIFNFDNLRVLAPDAVQVELQFSRYEMFGFVYWTGTNWSSTPTRLPTVLTSGRWRLTGAPPSRANWPQFQGTAVHAYATDAASNQTSVNILLTRTAPDASLPVASVQSPANGSVLALPSLPALQGMASDPESQIASVSLTLARFLPEGGVAFWNGTSWGETSVNLPVTHDAVSGIWTAPAGWNLPNGATLPNGGYSVQITATNREIPAGTTGAGITFTVDYHPVYTWTGLTLRDANPNNNSNSWDTAHNWDPYGVPGADDVAVIDTNDTVNVPASKTVNGLRLRSGTLSLSNATTLTSTGSSEWNGGFLTGIWENTGTLTLGGTGRQLNSAAQLRNYGTVTWSSGITTGFDTNTITNYPSGTWILAGSGDAFSQVYGGNQFISQGILRHSSGFTVDLNDWSYTLSGEIQKYGGTTNVNATCTLLPSTRFVEAGTFLISGGTTSVNGIIESPLGVFEIAGGTLEAAPFAILDGVFRWSGGTFSGHFTVPAGRRLNLTGACRLASSATLNNSGTVEWASTSPLEGFDSATIVNQPGGLWRFASSGNAFSSIYGGNVFTNLGTMEVSNSFADLLIGAGWTYHFGGSFNANTTAAHTTRFSSTCLLYSGASFQGTGAIAFSSNTTLKGPVAFSAPSSVTGGTFTGEALGLIQGAVTWSAGAFSGITRVAAGSQLNITGMNARTLNSSAALDIAGTLVWGTGGLTGFDTNLVTIRNSGNFQITGSGAFSSTYGGNRLVVESGGSVSKTSSGTCTITWAVENAGSVVVQAGDLELSSGGSSSGSFSTAPGAFLRFTNGTQNLSAGASLAGGIEITGGSVLATGNASGRIDVKGGIFGSSGSAVFSFAAASTWTGGSLAGNTRVPVGTSLTISGSNAKQLNSNAILVSEGLLEWSGGEVITGFENSTIDVRSGSTFRLAADGNVLADFYGGNQLIVSGTLEKSGGSGFTLLQRWNIRGSGTWRPITGNLHIQTPVELLPGSAFQGAARTRFLSSTVSARGVATIATGSTVELAGATLTGHADLTTAFQGGAFDWSAGQINGRVTLNSNSQLSTSSQKTLGSNAELRNSALLSLSGSGTLLGFDTSTLQNLPAATLVLSGSPITQIFGGNRLINEGTMAIGSSPVLQTLPWLFQQTATGTLQIEVAGSNATTPEFDQLQSTGGIQLAGTLQVSKTGTYQPPIDTTFVFLSGSSVTGTFSNVLAPGFSVEYAGSSATLRATAAGMNYQDWADDNELQGLDAVATADPDRDGVNNLLEYAFNSDPLAPGVSTVTSSTMEFSGEQWIVLHYRRWQNRIDAGLSYQPETSTNLGVWGVAGITDEVDPDASAIPGSEARRCRIPVTTGSRFLRLSVE